ncbi:ALP1-like protein isoform X1 [Tanacetum coccineum]
MSDSTGGMTDLDDIDDMEMIMQQLRYEQSLQEQEAESSNHLGANNDITVLNNSPLFDDLLDDIAPVAPFKVNGVTFQQGYILADGIYPQWSSFIKSFSIANSEKMHYLNEDKKVLEKTLKELLGSFKGFGILYANHRVNGLSTSYAESCTRTLYCIT